MKKFQSWAASRSLKAKIQTAANALQSITEAVQPAQAQSTEAWSDQNFIKWLKGNGAQVVLGQMPTYKDGGAGRAYFLGDKVVKFTDNRVEANVANMVANNPNTPTRIFGVYRFKPRLLWAILQKKVNMDLPQMISRASETLMNYVDETSVSEFPTVPNQRMKVAKKAITMAEESPDLLPFVLEIMDALDKLYRNTGFFHDDAVPANIGMDNGKPVIPDLGPNVTKDYNVRKALDNVHATRKKLGLPDIDEI